MSHMIREATIEFTCERTRCSNESAAWPVEGRFNAEGEFEPNNIDELGSDADCPECGERGEPADASIRLVDQ